MFIFAYVNNIIESIYPEISKMSKVISSGNELSGDLSQEVALYLLTLGEEKITMLHESGGLLNYTFRVAYLKWNSNNGIEVGAVNNSCFKAVYRDYHKITEDIDNCHDKGNIALWQDAREFLDVATLLNSLSTLDRLTIEELMSVNFNMSLLSSRTNINRNNLKVRIDAIYDKLRGARD